MATICDLAAFLTRLEYGSRRLSFDLIAATSRCECESTAALQDMLRRIKSPLTAILVVPGTLENSGLSVISKPAPYGLHGLPGFTYSIQYSARDHPDVAHRVQDLLQNAASQVTTILHAASTMAHLRRSL